MFAKKTDFLKRWFVLAYDVTSMYRVFFFTQYKFLYKTTMTLLPYVSKAPVTRQGFKALESPGILSLKTPEFLGCQMLSDIDYGSCFLWQVSIHLEHAIFWKLYSVIRVV